MQTNRGILSADYKVAGGKLLRVRLSLSEDAEPPTIKAITITGDFFMHPENAIEELEQTLTGIVFQESAVQNAVQLFFDSGVEVIGAGPADFVHIILHVI
jgi:hypothetical protein